ncbi:shikimate dehydrogenase [Bacillus tianshenii]|nr:shikimate dehydrogenase [Bacillus tianshenii]
MGELYGLLGHPVGHSMSPVMHNDAFAALDLPHHYHAFDVHPDELTEAVKGLKALGVKGFNVTIPHKVNIMPLLDVIDEEAAAIGAVNTVVNENGKLIGYNTDGQGYIESLLPKLTAPLSAQKLLLIGAGGAARAIFVSLANRGVKQVDIANRTVSKAETIIADCPFPSASKALSLEEAETAINDYDVIIQTTAVGMSPKVDEMPLRLGRLEKGKIISDIIYNPLKTKWLSTAEEKGAIIHGGIGMFVGQGALAFERWTGIQPDMKRMESIVRQQLGG